MLMKEINGLEIDIHSREEIEILLELIRLEVLIIFMIINGNFKSIDDSMN